MLMIDESILSYAAYPVRRLVMRMQLFVWQTMRKAGNADKSIVLLVLHSSWFIWIPGEENENEMEMLLVNRKTKKDKRRIGIHVFHLHHAHKHNEPNANWFAMDDGNDRIVVADAKGENEKWIWNTFDLCTLQ